MKTIFIHSKYTGKVDLNKIEVDKLPNKLGLVTTTQFLDKTIEIKQFLENNGKEVFIEEGKQRNEGQLLGCDVGAAIKIHDKVDAFLYIGSGEFHPLGVAMNTKKDVFTFNPVTGVFSKLNNEEIEKYKKNKKANYVKFLSAENIGDTNPENAEPTSIRGKYGRITSEGVFENVVHSSENEKESEREIKLWFRPEELVQTIYPTESREVKKLEYFWKS